MGQGECTLSAKEARNGESSIHKQSCVKMATKAMNLEKGSQTLGIGSQRSRKGSQVTEKVVKITEKVVKHEKDVFVNLKLSH